MGNNNYARGAAFERKVQDYLQAKGYYAVRAAGSHGLTDVVADPPVGKGYMPEKLYIQCKTGKGRMSLKDRNELHRVAMNHDALPYLAVPNGSGIDFYYIGWDATLLLDKEL